MGAIKDAEQKNLVKGRACAAKGCTRGIYARDWCHRHYQLVLAQERAERGDTCQWPEGDECPEGRVVGGLCLRHWNVKNMRKYRRRKAEEKWNGAK